MRLVCVPALLMLTLLSSPAAPAQWAIEQNADLVLGQKDYVSSSSGAGPDSLYAPTDVAIDPLTRKLFVADIANHRVLRWGRVDSLKTGQAAEAVLGQPDMESHTAATAANRMDFPTAIAFDRAGRLWVADAINNRVLRFDSAGFKPSSAPANGVLGQPNFTSNAAGLAQDSMNYVRGIAVDDAGHLWVADQENNRVLRFDNAASRPNGAAADGVLGQPDFTTSRDTISRSSLDVPRGLVVDTQGRLYVADSYGSRVLRFDNAAGKPNGANADGVLGAVDFDSASGEVSRSSMTEPWGVELDGSGRLYVTDDGSNRLTWFDTAYAKANGADADGVLGQPDFVTGTAMTAQNRLSAPWGVCIDPVKNTMWVADAGNNRVLRFTASTPLTGIASTGIRPSEFSLGQNYPNPFNPGTTITYDLSRAAYVSLRVYNMLGQEVATLVDGLKQPGSYAVRFNPSGLASGMYFYRMAAGQFVQTRRFVVLK